MDSLQLLALSIAGVSMTATLFVVLLVVVIGFIAILAYWILAFVLPERRRRSLTVERHDNNPLMGPDPKSWWESEAVFNPGVCVDGNTVHMFYRALGGDGISRIGYAWSNDGVHFERYPEPVYDCGPSYKTPKPTQTQRRRRPLSYNTDIHASGGGWAGCEDPRAVIIEDEVHITFSRFETWQSIRMAVASLMVEDLRRRWWKWSPQIAMSPAGQTHKNWVLFPEKIKGKYAVLHALTPSVTIEYVESLDDLHRNPIQSNNHRSGRPGAWDAFVRGAAAPPIKTSEGWLLLYHGMNPAQSSVGYRVGAMLLDLNDPTRVLYRSNQPILEPTEWYENDWKPGVVYASGAIVFHNDLIIYYGGGDKYIAAARVPLKDFLYSLKHHQQPLVPQK